jgi:hypothetical protein
VQAENVTDRYAAKKAASEKVRVQVRGRREGTKERVAVPVEVVERGGKDVVARGVSKGEGADTNDLLTFGLTEGREYVVRVGGKAVEKVTKVAAGKEMVKVEVEKTGATRE